MTSIFFCYERAMTGNWQPACYHDSKPGKHQEVVGLVEVPADCMDKTDWGDEPNFGKLVKRFPLEVAE
jgi:hypothetical protein